MGKRGGKRRGGRGREGKRPEGGREEWREGEGGRVANEGLTSNGGFATDRG